MSPAVMSVVGVALLLAVLGFAFWRPRGLPEVVLAAPAAGATVLLGIASPQQAWESVHQLGPTLIFLGATLLIAHLLDRDGVFEWLGGILGVRSAGRPARLLLRVFIAAAVTTAVLSLDATVVLLTPAILVTVKRLRFAAAPPLYASAHLANSASLLLPVSNLTNLLAYQAVGLSFAGFTSLMALPWVGAVLVEYAVFRLYFRQQLVALPAAQQVSADTLRAAPRTCLAILAAILAGFGLSPLAGVESVWVAVAGASVLAVRALLRRETHPRALLREINVPFIAFVACLAIVVAGATSHGIESALAALLPSGTSWWSLVMIAGLAAALSNVVNNLPATLLLVAALGHPAAPAAVLAVLIGVNIGPNLTYTGSLATLLWRRVLVSKDAMPSLKTFTLLGVATAPAAIIVAVTGLWVALTYWG
ncbi:arsenic transporter [Nakamurella antarctica]|uniref:Arsenic transporter n=1 Tax=Nakamurella antarctica TaxID=1902245 RepID=A0A3G8ZLI1_9ACTN|nr:SLC13 family permease [Nakamurella antarctica]AZI58070.1 arsenic transporter [Nakamurella antarctica]